MGGSMAIKQEINKATKILNKMYKKFMENTTEEQWQKILEEVKQARIEADGVVLEGAELEETAKANILARLARFAQSKGDKDKKI